MNDVARPVRWNWRRQDYKAAAGAAVMLVVLGAICTMRPGDDPALSHVGNNIITGTVWIGLPAGLLTMGLRGVPDNDTMSLVERLIYSGWGVAGLLAGIVVLLGWS